MSHRIATTSTLILVALLLAACASMPKTPDQTVYATYGLYIAVANATADALDAGSIDRDQAQRIQQQLQQIRPQLAAARQLVAGDQSVPADALGYVQAAQAALLAIQQQLQTGAP